MSEKNKTANDWLTEIIKQEKIATQIDVVPKGWKTVRQVAEQLNLSDNAAKARLHKWIKEGKVEKRRFRIFSFDQHRLVWFYNEKG